MRLPPAAVGLVALAVTAVCLAAGFWQLGRLGQKQERNARLRAVLAAPPETLAWTPEGLARQAGRKVVATGAYDETRQILLSARFHAGEIGVDVVTPLRDPRGGALLVNRGWLAAEDGVTADPASVSEPGPRSVTGVLERLPARTGAPRWRRLEGAGAAAWSTHELDSASVAGFAPYRLEPFVLLALPGPAAPAHPARRGPAPLDEQVHVSYAIQWFSFALVTVVGTLALAFRMRARRASSVGSGA